jgi:hypothetical protein
VQQLRRPFFDSGTGGELVGVGKATGLDASLGGLCRELDSDGGVTDVGPEHIIERYGYGLCDTCEASAMWPHPPRVMLGITSAGTAA